MSKLLIQYKDNYADEFDISGFMIVEESEWNMYLKFLQSDKIAWPQCWYFGTNEGVQFDSLGELLSCYTRVQISDAEAEFLEMAFGVENSGQYGQFCYFDTQDDWVSDPHELW